MMGKEGKNGREKVDELGDTGVPASPLYGDGGGQSSGSKWDNACTLSSAAGAAGGLSFSLSLSLLLW